MNKPTKILPSKEIEWLSLDDYVSDGNGETLYIRVRGNDFEGLQVGDLVVCSKGRNPKAGDLVVWEDGGSFGIKKFVAAPSPLRLIARNGATVEGEAVSEPMEIIGVLTHVLKTI